MRIDLYIHLAEPEPDPRLDTLIGLITKLTTGVTQLSGTVNTLDADITQLQGDVSAGTTVITSATTLINGFAAKLADAVAAAKAAGASDAQLQALNDLHTKLDANNASLAAAVAANTTTP